ncbi:hypothetical protein MT418_002333 [Batrachochytrium dendrobatidis]
MQQIPTIIHSMPLLYPVCKRLLGCVSQSISYIPSIRHRWTLPTHVTEFYSKPSSLMLLAIQNGRVWQYGSTRHRFRITNETHFTCSTAYQRSYSTIPSPKPAVSQSDSSVQQPVVKLPKYPTENIYTLPNALTVSRILMTPIIGYLIVQQSFTMACGLLAVAAFTDLLDGFLARQYNQKTVLGSVLDPAADKILMVTLAVSLCQAGLVPFYLASLIIFRDIALVAATAFYRYISLSPPKTIARYFDVSLPSAEVHPPLISKINTFLQLALMAASISMPIIGLTEHCFLTCLQYATGITTIWSGLHYLISPNVIKILKQ